MVVGGGGMGSAENPNPTLSPPVRHFPAPRPNPLPAVCFQNGGPLRTLDLQQASACQKTPALHATTVTAKTANKNTKQRNLLSFITISID